MVLSHYFMIKFYFFRFGLHQFKAEPKLSFYQKKEKKP